MENIINFTVAGEGKPVVLIHGWATCAKVWNGLGSALSKKFKVIAPDLRGHGKSSEISTPYNFKTFADDIRAVIDILNIKPVTLVGWSMGGSIALRLIESYPDYADSLVLIGATPSLIKSSDSSFGLPPVVVRRLASQVEKNFEAGITKFHNMVFTPEELSRLGKNPLCDYTPRKKPSVDSLKCLMEEDAGGILGAVNIPTLIIHGSSDTICLPKGAKHIKNSIKDSELLMLSETGHAPFLTRPQEAVSAIQDFILDKTVKSDYNHQKRV